MNPEAMRGYEEPSARQRRYAAVGAASLPLLYGRAASEGVTRLGPEAYLAGLELQRRSRAELDALEVSEVEPSLDTTLERVA
ncbi:hypothetical protein HY489_01960 [Candidatus Woesearchaeota archaeon]|nr:hypothetical protein [Candidatus Woesearchaeota archaeon]